MIPFSLSVTALSKINAVWFRDTFRSLSDPMMKVLAVISPGPPLSVKRSLYDVEKAVVSMLYIDALISNWSLKPVNAGVSPSLKLVTLSRLVKMPVFAETQPLSEMPFWFIVTLLLKLKNDSFKVTALLILRP